MYKNLFKSSIICMLLIMCGCSKFFTDLKSSDPDMPLETGEQNAEDPSIAAQESQTKEGQKPHKRVTREDFVDQSQEEGSLWASSGQTNYYFTKNKVRSPGDIVTVKIENDLYRGISAEIKKSLSPEEKTVELVEAKETLRQKLMKLSSQSNGKDSITTSAASPERPSEGITSGNSASPAETPGTSEAIAAGMKAGGNTAAEIEKQIMQLSLSELDISSSLEIKNGDMMMGEIVGRYPNGNYKIRATKKVLYKKGQAREVTVLAIVKAADIGEDSDAVNSGKLYDYQVEVAH